MRAAVVLLVALGRGAALRRPARWRALTGGFADAPWRGEAAGDDLSGAHTESPPDWDALAAAARCASLVYYDAATIVAAHERGRYGRAAARVDWRADGSAVATWRATRYGDVELVVRELPAHGMRYFVRTETARSGAVAQHVAVKGSDNLRNFKDDVDYAKVPRGGVKICL